MRTTTSKLPPDTYFKLVKRFPLRRISSAAQHRQAKEMVLEIARLPEDSGHRDYIEVLVSLIDDYEKQALHASDAKVPVADLVRHRIQERGLSISALAKQIGIPQPNLASMLNNQRDWSKAAIRGLTSLLNIRAERFLV